jgi:hypothetical protein
MQTFLASKLVSEVQPNSECADLYETFWDAWDWKHRDVCYGLNPPCGRSFVDVNWYLFQRLAPPTMPYEIKESASQEDLKHVMLYDVVVTKKYVLHSTQQDQGRWICTNSMQNVQTVPSQWTDYLIMPSGLTKSTAQKLHAQFLQGVLYRKDFVDLVTNVTFYKPLRVFVFDCRGTLSSAEWKQSNAQPFHNGTICIH